MKINSQNPFPPNPDAPAPLRLRIKREIHFNECDPMGIVWNGNYARFFEEVREAFSKLCGLDFDTLREAQILLPIKTLFFDYCKPLRYGLEYTLEIEVHWSKSLRINTEYHIFDQQGSLCTNGFSVQLLVDEQGTLILDPPPFYEKFKAAWAGGKFSALQNTPGSV